MSQSKLLLQRSAQEAGLDEQNAVLDLTRQRLYGEFTWHSSGRPQNEADALAALEGAAIPLQITKRSATTTNLVIKQRYFMEQFAASPFHVKVNQSVDVVRYSTREQQLQQSKEPDLLVLEAIGKKLANDERHIPTELGPKRTAAAEAAKKLRAKKVRKNKAAKWDDLEKREKMGDLGEGKTGEEEEEEEDDGEPIEAEDPGEEEGDDYIQDHYASDDEGGGADGGDEGGGGGDDEAVF